VRTGACVTECQKTNVFGTPKSLEAIGTRKPVQKGCRKPSLYGNSRSRFLYTPRMGSRPKTATDGLEPEPAVLTGALIGYARVSTRDQSLDRQLDALAQVGCIRVFADRKSGKDTARAELVKALDFMRPGDTLVVASLDRLSRSLQDLIAMVADLRRREVGFRSLHESLDTTTPGGRLVFHVFAALAEFIRELIVEGTREGLDAARARGRVGGRPPVMTPEKILAARSLLPDNSISAIARMVGVSRGTLYAHMAAITAEAGS